MLKPPGEAEYTIASVSKLTGISCHSLRVWERRYGFPVPRRSASGHRRFSREQVRLLRRLSERFQRGESISELIAEAIAGRIEVEPEPEVGAGAAAGAAGAVSAEAILEPLIAGDLARADACFARLTAALDTSELVARVVAPALVEVGERWFRRECDVFHERNVSGFLRRKLGTLIDAARSTNVRPARTIVIGTVEGDRHEGGTLLLHLLLEQAGWRVVNLGVDLPIREYVKAVARWSPDALGLSFVLSRNIKKRFQELDEVRGRPIFVGGRSILNYQSLARRHGLIPLPGPIATASRQLGAEYEAWLKTTGRRPGGETSP